MNCPDASHLTRFNTLGNLPPIREFWRRKLARDAAAEEDIYAEGTHLHAKAGLVENLDLAPEGVRVVLVALRREPLKVVWSLQNRFDFANYGFTWLFALDPRYRNVIVDAKPMRDWGATGGAIWYVIEMETRAAYYRRLVANRPGIDVHATSLEEIVTEEGAAALLAAITGERPAEVTLSPPANELQQTHYPEALRDEIARMLGSLKWDPEALAETYFSSGRRLAAPPKPSA